MQENKPGNLSNLADFICEQKSAILKKWEIQARAEVKAANTVEKLVLIDSMPEYLDELCKMLSSSTLAKKIGHTKTAAVEHGEQRARIKTYRLDQVIMEFQLLREVIFETVGSYSELSDDGRKLIHRWIDTGIRQAAQTFVDDTESNATLAHRELYDFIMQAPTPMSILIGSEMRFLMANPAYEHFVARRVTGKTVLEAFTKEEVGYFLPILEEVFQTGIPYIGKEIPFIIPDHNGILKNYYLNIRYHPFREDDGTIKGILVDVNDVTEQVESRQLIEDNEKLIMDYADSMPQMAFIANGDGYITFYNKHHFQYFGVSEKDHEGWGWKENNLTVHEDDLERTVKSWEESLSTGKKYEIEYRLRRHDGEYRWHLGRAIPILDEKKNIVRWYGTNTDIHDQKVAEEAVKNAEQMALKSEATAREIANNLPMIVWTARPDGYVDYYNDWWYEYLGQPRGTEWDDPKKLPMHPDDVARTIKVWNECLKTGSFYTMEQRFRRASDGQYRWHLVRGNPIRDKDGVITKWIGGNTDIHDAKLLTEELREAQAAAEAANQSKSSFLANMSHEIRTPLGAIIGFANLLRHSDLTKEEGQNYLNVIDRNSSQLLRVIDDILDLAKVEAGQMTIENVDFSLMELLADISSLMGFRARENGIHFELKAETSLPDKINSDPVRIRQVLNNIVGNAIKFTHNGSVVLSACFKDDFLEFSVTDTGRGISPEQIEKLFKPFAQADISTTRKYGGTGLGLVLTKNICQAFDGDFTLVQSELGLGSTFEAKMKVSLAKGGIIVDKEDVNFISSSVKQDLDKNKKLQGLRILLVEDSPDNQILIRIMVQKLGAEILIASDGVEGIQMALAEDFDIVLMDIQMPRKDGHQTVKELRAMGYKVPIIALTAHAMKEEVDRTRTSGFSGFLSKPIYRKELIETVLSFTKGKS